MTIGGRVLVFIILILFIIALDQVSKLAAIKFLMDQKPYVIIRDHFELRYVENYGAAFGILQQRRLFFLIITSIVILALIIYFYKNFDNLSIISKISISFFIGGAIGNFIDRLRLGYVVDFLRVNIFKGYDFPVFNIADMFIVVGTILIVYVVIFDKYEV